MRLISIVHDRIGAVDTEQSRVGLDETEPRRMSSGQDVDFLQRKSRCQRIDCASQTAPVALSEQCRVSKRGKGKGLPSDDRSTYLAVFTF